jgi:hypothetical protein
MEKMIGYCGYNCHLCAARSDDPQVRQKLVEGWKKFFGHQNYTAENVRCDCCKADGRLADKSCKARPCAIEKKIASCALCNEFPCDKVRNLLASREGMLLYLYPRTKNITEQEFNLCMRQFLNMPNLLKILVEKGKIPASLVKKDEE